MVFASACCSEETRAESAICFSFMRFSFLHTQVIGLHQLLLIAFLKQDAAVFQEEGRHMLLGANGARDDAAQT